MRDPTTFAQRLAPDTINRLLRAAQNRYESANMLKEKKRGLAALYFYGYAAEICLAAAYFRSVGFAPNAEIDRDTRNRRMAQARLLQIMPHDPHPLIGWARFLEYQRTLGQLTAQDRQRLREAVNKATLIYAFWRPELRYKVTDIGDEQLRKIQTSARWMLDNQPLL